MGKRIVSFTRSQSSGFGWASVSTPTLVADVEIGDHLMSGAKLDLHLEK
ncbi:MAG TPA: hypothetical protein VG734_06410 [Lacunisphaera sp.]|nr:hypothetical protein [Lacunisphaera sp.]